MIQQRKVQCIKNVQNGMFISMTIYRKLYVEIISYNRDCLVFFSRKIFGKTKINYPPVHYGSNSYVFLLNSLIMKNML